MSTPVSIEQRTAHHTIPAKAVEGNSELDLWEAKQHSGQTALSNLLTRGVKYNKSNVPSSPTPSTIMLTTDIQKGQVC